MSRSSSLDVNVPLLRPHAHPASRSRSRPGSRPRGSRHSTTNSLPSLAHNLEDVINPNALINEEDAELFQDLVNPHSHEQHHHTVEETLVEDEGEDEDALALESGAEEEDEGDDVDWKENLPWWKRPSPWWFLAYVPFAAIAMSITAAAKIELFTYLACQSHRPVYNPDEGGAGPVSALVGRAVAAFADPGQRACAQDPVVQVAVAKLTVIMTTTMGILTCLTTAWWGSLSDRYGRTKVLSCAVVGVLVMDMNFLCVFWFYDYIPGGYYFLTLGPLVEGALGGQALISATIHAYMADCTPPALRSGMFSLHLGLLFTGIGIGPTLGGLLIRFTKHFIIVFYVSAIIHIIYALLVWFIIPESLSRSQLLEARARHKAASEEYRAAHAQGGLVVLAKRMFAFLTPLSIFLPVEIQEGNPAKGKRRDWNLLLLVIAYGCTVSLVGLYLYIIQYLTGVYGWDTEQVGYWFSSIGVARAVFLTLILPTVIRVVKSRSSPIQLPTEQEEPLTSPTTPTPTPTPPPPPPPATAARSSSHGRPAQHNPKFDLSVARVSLGVDVLVYALILAANSGLMFAAMTALGAFAMGFGPATQAVALALYNQRGGKDSGRLFGAMSVVQAMCSQVLGPFVYGMTYAKTVATFPKAIFFVAGGVVFFAFVLVLFVRLPDHVPVYLDVEVQQGAGAGAGAGGARGVEREETLVEQEPLIVVEDEGRGRKVIKP